MYAPELSCGACGFVRLHSVGRRAPEVFEAHARVPLLALSVPLLALSVPLLALSVPEVFEAHARVPLLALSVRLLALSVPLLALSVPLLALSVPLLALSVPEVFEAHARVFLGRLGLALEEDRHHLQRVTALVHAVRQPTHVPIEWLHTTGRVRVGRGWAHIGTEASQGKARGGG